MSSQRPTVLYVGSPETGTWLKDLVAPLDGYVYQPVDLLETLAMFVSYYPDIVILDTRWDSYLAERLYFHLNSVDAEPILVLDSVPERWLTANLRTTQVVSDETALCRALNEMLHWAGAEPCQIVTPSYR